jgi:hypothetical protein
MCDRCKKEAGVRTGVGIGGINGRVYWLCNECLAIVKWVIEDRELTIGGMNEKV